MKTLSTLLLAALTSLTTLATDFKTNYAAKALEGLNRPSYSAPKAGPEAQAKAVESIKGAKLLFIENNGQIADQEGKLHPEILFTAKAGGAQVYVTGNSIHYVFTKVERETKRMSTGRPEERDSIKSVSTHRFTLELEGANRNPELVKQDGNLYYENYYLAHCPNGVVAHSYEKFTLKQVYPSVDWVVYSNGQGLKYDFVLAKGSDAAKIKLRVKDADANLNAEGDLVMKTTLGEVIEDKPVSFQEGRKIETSFKQLGNQRFGFSVPNANANEPLTIDPSVVWATYYGAADRDQGLSCTTDAASNVYLAGSTNSTDFPVIQAFQGFNRAGSYEAFLVKFNSAGNRLWATYYGGTNSDYSFSCTTDLDGNVYITGETSSFDLPVYGAYQGVHVAADDAFLAKFNSTGSRLWCTYYGGNSYDSGMNCATDVAGNVYLAGFTHASDLPVIGAFQARLRGTADAFLVKFSSTGSCEWATYFGGNGFEFGLSCATDYAGNIYFAGSTNSSDLPVVGSFQGSFAGGTYDAFLVKFSSTGTRLWATYYGGNIDDYSYSCATDGMGNVYLAGETRSTNLPVAAAFQANLGGMNQDAFIVKFSSTGSRLWATYYGGNGDDYGYSCAIDVAGNVYLAGKTSSTNFPVAGGFQGTFAGGSDAFLVKFNNTGSRLWATYFGGNDWDEAKFCTNDLAGNMYMAGFTLSNNFPVSGAFQGTKAANLDAFIVKISDTTATSLGPVLTNSILTLHPNPATNLVQLNLSYGEIKHVEVLDKLGRVVLVTKALPNNQLDISGLAAGSYFVRVITHDGVAVKQLVKE